ncbi:MAG: sigma-70 family RNA polymerase sigma factor [Planctomycetes bacterium]|nr:sigma-70 family RNA polymerase sigma factor [Planctomycetota bacterium]
MRRRARMIPPTPSDLPGPERLTSLLQAAGAGDAGALEELFAHTYRELRQIAARQLQGERAGHTLQATALVHEAFLRLVQQDTCSAGTPSEFLGVAALVMRRILVDHARRRGRRKRGGGGASSVLEAVAETWNERAIDLIALDQALTELGQRDATKARLVELRFFCGASMAEAAMVLQLPLRTLEREWTLARAYLRARVGEVGA